MASWLFILARGLLTRPSRVSSCPPARPQFLKRGAINKYTEAEILNHSLLRHPHVIQFKVRLHGSYCVDAMQDQCQQLPHPWLPSHHPRVTILDLHSTAWAPCAMGYMHASSHERMAFNAQRHAITKHACQCHASGMSAHVGLPACVHTYVCAISQPALALVKTRFTNCVQARVHVLGVCLCVA